MALELLTTVTIILVFTETIVVSAFVVTPTVQLQNLVTTTTTTTQYGFSTASSFLINDSTAAAVSEVDAFTDEINLFGDPTIQLIFVGFVIAVIFVIGAKALINNMDEAIGIVLIEFETTMKEKYPTRWVSIETKLNGLIEPERSQKLFTIMEELTKSEPDFMAKVNKDMGS